MNMRCVLFVIYGKQSERPMRMRTKHYCAVIHEHGYSAKNKGIILDARVSSTYSFYPGQPKPVTLGNNPFYCIEAVDDEDAYAQLCRMFKETDKRPLAGKSYLRQCRTPRVGQRVWISGGYRIGYNDNGTEKRAHNGVVTEAIDDRHVSVHPDGYHNQYVDFHINELRIVRGK